MKKSNLEIQEKIKKEFLQTNKSRNIKIPSKIHLSIDDNTVKMKLSSMVVSSNMQTDDGAFEGWALVLKRWGKYEKVIIAWDKPEKIDNGHYQRFLFRLQNFSKDFQSWFYIDKNCQLFLDDLKIKNEIPYLLNVPSKRIANNSSQPEAKLEDRFIYRDLKEPLKKISNAVNLYRQLPVGVFNSKVSKNTSIFTAGKSAIDIWGYNRSNELLVFELKADTNQKVGIISELYFYVCVLLKIQKQLFKHENCLIENEHLLKIPTTKKIRAYFLSKTLHPLVDKEILILMNNANFIDVSYHYIKIGSEDKLSLDF